MASGTESCSKPLVWETTRMCFLGLGGGAAFTETWRPGRTARTRATGATDRIRFRISFNFDCSRRVSKLTLKAYQNAPLSPVSRPLPSPPLAAPGTLAPRLPTRYTKDSDDLRLCDRSHNC